MPYIVDILLILIFGAVIILSMKKGFVISLFELVGTVISFVAARVLSDSLAPTIFEEFVRGGAENALAQNLGDVATTDYGTQIEQAINSIPQSFSALMELMGIEKQALIDKIASADYASGSLLDTIMTNVVDPVGTAVVQFVLFAVLVALITVILRFVVRLLDAIIKKLPAIKQMNSALGAVVGVVKGALICVIIALVVSVAAGFINNEGFIKAVDSSFVVGAVQNLFTTFSGITI